MIASSEPIRTLLADDVVDLRMCYRMVLEATGRFQVVAEAGNGAEAVAMARQYRPDLVLLDVSMPVSDGFAALPLIVADSPAAKVVMLSGFEAGALAPAALERGAAAYIEKGITPAKLVAELLRIMGSIEMEEGSQPWLPSDPPPEATPVTSEELLSFVAHELRDPLAVIQGFATTLESRWGFLTKDEGAFMVQRIAAQARYLDGVVRSMLQLRKMDDAPALLEPATLQATELLDTMADDLASLAPEHAFSVAIEHDVTVSVDPERFKQVLTNLVGNSARYSPAGTRITIGIARKGDHAVVQVRDEGPGIPLEDRERVFERFTRLGRSGPGLGLGLYISRSLMQAMGGDVWISDSTIGTTVSCSFPVAEG